MNAKHDKMTVRAVRRAPEPSTGASRAATEYLERALSAQYRHAAALALDAYRAGTLHNPETDAAVRIFDDIQNIVSKIV